MARRVTKYLLIYTLLFGFTLSLAATALAHATLVLGELQSDPVTPHAGEPFRLTLEMEDVIQAPIASAVVHAEFRPRGTAESEAPETNDSEAETDPVLRGTFEETSEGRYQVALVAPEQGAWTLTLRDQTYPWEDATATLDFYVAGQGNEATARNDETIDFLFPPTAVMPPGLSTWLIWLVVIPIVAGGVVTVMVLRGSGQQQPGTPETHG